ncbi:MAG: SDR family NAD(P)-dependent oxidoreductase [Ferruginibacter sp.]
MAKILITGASKGIGFATALAFGRAGHTVAAAMRNPAALPFLGWRQSMTDEQWIELGAMEDDAWYDRIESDFSMKVRP